MNFPEGMENPPVLENDALVIYEDGGEPKRRLSSEKPRPKKVIPLTALKVIEWIK